MSDLARWEPVGLPGEAREMSLIQGLADRATDMTATSSWKSGAG